MSIRKSLMDLNRDYIIERPNYTKAKLPDELMEYCYYLLDSGYVIMAIPKSLFDDNVRHNDLDDFECPVPMKYVLQKGYTFYNNHVIVDAPYFKFGLEVDEEYYEYMSIRDVREWSGMSRSEFCDRFKIPYRTLQDWELNKRMPPDYIIVLLIETLIRDGKSKK